MMSLFSKTAPYKSALLQTVETPLAVEIAPPRITPAPKEPSALDQVIEMAKTPPSYDLEALTRELEERQGILNSLFPIETTAREKVSEQITELSAKKNIANILHQHAGKYLPVSIEVLRWRKSDGLPKLALFSLESPHFSIVSDSYGRDHLSPNLPPTLAATYSDVQEALRARAHSMKRNDHVGYAMISAIFSGVIPESTRGKIKEAMGVFEAIFILAEPDLKYEENFRHEPAPLPVDPVVLGWDGQQLWYIDDFDITPVEEAAILYGAP